MKIPRRRCDPKPRSLATVCASQDKIWVPVLNQLIKTAPNTVRLLIGELAGAVCGENASNLNTPGGKGQDIAEWKLRWNQALSNHWLCVLFGMDGGPQHATKCVQNSVLGAADASLVLRRCVQNPPGPYAAALAKSLIDKFFKNDTFASELRQLTCVGKRLAGIPGGSPGDDIPRPRKRPRLGELQSLAKELAGSLRASAEADAVRDTDSSAPQRRGGFDGFKDETDGFKNQEKSSSIVRYTTWEPCPLGFASAAQARAGAAALCLEIPSHLLSFEEAHSPDKGAHLVFAAGGVDKTDAANAESKTRGAKDVKMHSQSECRPAHQVPEIAVFGYD